MLTLKTSILAAALAAGLAVSFVPQPGFAQTRPGWVDPDSPTGQFLDDVDKTNKALDDLDKKFHPKPKKAVLPQPAPAPPPAPAPAPKSFWDQVYDFFFGSAATPKDKLVVAALKTVDLKNVARKSEAVDMLTSRPAAKLVLTTDAPKPAEINLNTVENIKARINEPLDAPAAIKPAAKLVLPATDAPKQAELNLNTVENIKPKRDEPVETLMPKSTTKTAPTTDAPKQAELNLNTVEKIKAKSNELVVPTTPKPTAKIVSTETPRAGTSTVLRPTVTTTVSRIEVSRPMVNVHPTINIPRPTINIPVVVRR